jgi:hypothetical protein
MVDPLPEFSFPSIPAPLPAPTSSAESMPAPDPEQDLAMNQAQAPRTLPSIFVQLASYRDLQLLPTIDSLLSNADHPEMFSFGICWQYGSDEEDPNVFDACANFRVTKVPYNESKGLGWARSVTNSLWRGEDLTLQIDSHHRFSKGWDSQMLLEWAQASALSDKPILTTYVPPFSPDVPITDTTPSLMAQYEFSPDRLLMSMPHYIMDHLLRTHVIRARTLSAHFFLVRGKFIEEVAYDPDIYFGGYTEETTLSARAWTNGYDFFSPFKCYLWHEYTRSYRPKHWEDHSDTGLRDGHSRDRTRQLFGQQDYGIDLGTFGLGSVRTLHEYEVYAGFDFKNCRIQPYTLRVNEPPNPPDWEAQFIEYDHLVRCNIDMALLRDDFERAGPEQAFDFIALGIETSNGVSIHRVDMNRNSHPNVFALDAPCVELSFRTRDEPHRWVLFPHSPNGTWGTRQEQLIPRGSTVVPSASC